METPPDAFYLLRAPREFDAPPHEAARPDTRALRVKNFYPDGDVRLKADATPF
jgi:hypothetical protein